MDKFNSPDPIIFDGNITEHWKRWQQELQLYLAATEKGKKENKVRSSILFYLTEDRKVEKFIRRLFFNGTKKVFTTMIL